MPRDERANATLSDYGDLFLPEEAAEPILGAPVRAALLEWLTEIWAEAALTAVGIKPRRRAIFDGPPGVGKTTLAHHLSARLGLPMLAVRPDRIIDCWVGSTGRNIGSVFDLAAAGLDEGGAEPTPIVLFLDEFDAIAGERLRARTGAESHRNDSVDTLLQRLEQHAGFVIAATNFGAHIDPAIWRRFDMHISLELPGQVERERIAARYLEPFGLPREALRQLAIALDTASPALIRALAENLKRQIVIGPMLGSDMALRATVDRVLASVHPHPDLGKPRLWTLGAADHAVSLIPWPLPKAADLAAEVEPPAAPSATGDVVAFRGRA